MEKTPIFSIFWLILITFGFLQGCVSTSNTTQSVVEPKYNPVFDYAPPTRATTKSGIALALVAPTFVKGFLFSETEPFVSFSKNMANDFQELVIAKGYSFRGPFKSHDDMVFNDKKESNLLLLIDIDMTMDFHVETKTKTEMTGIPFINDRIITKKRMVGTIGTGGTINIMLTSSMKGVKLWKKSIALPNKTLIINGQNYYDETQKVNMFDDSGVANPIAKALEEYYTIALSTAWKHLEPEELKGIAQEALEADGRK